MNFDDVYREYYKKIFNFCYAKLGDRHLAEDCTQDVFLAFNNKMSSMKLSTNVGAWLYTAAKLQVKYYFRKNKGDVFLEDMPNAEEISAKETTGENFFEEILTEDEMKTLKDYYLNGEDIQKIAAEKGISTDALYQRVRRIKRKIVQNSDKLHNLLKK